MMMMMTMTRWIRGRSARRSTLLVALLGAAFGPLTALSPLSAQERAPRAERSQCACVDRDGKKIDDCTCLRTPLGVRGFALAGLPGVQRARLGVVVASGPVADAEARGARLESVTPGGPAADAGLAAGDIVTRLDGKSLLDPLDHDTEAGFDKDASFPVQRLLAIAGTLEPDQKVAVEYLRDGTTHTTTLETRDMGAWSTLRSFGVDAGALRDRLRSFERGAPRFQVGSNPGGLTWFSSDGGLDLADMNAGLGTYFGTDKGVLVTDVDADSTLGLQPGDVVLAVGDRAVSDGEHLRRILRSYDPDEDITFRVMRQKREITVEGHRPH